VEVVTLCPVAENVVEVKPAGMVTLVGTLTAVAGVAPIATTAPPLTAADESETVQVDAADCVTAVGLHEMPLSTGV
jgi:hypothetical protein